MNRRQIGYVNPERPAALVQRPTDAGSLNLESGEVFGFGEKVPDGSTLEIYSWGAYDASDGSTTNLTVELVDGTGTVQASETTDGTSDLNEPVAALENVSGTESVFRVRVSNGRSSTVDNTVFFAGFRVV